MATTTPDQLALDEKVVEDEALERLLEQRQSAKEAVAEQRGELTRIDKQVQAAVDDLDIGIDAAVRIGRFRIARLIRKGRDVSFSTEDKDAVSISLVDDES